MNKGTNRRLFVVLFVLLFVLLQLTKCKINNDSRDVNSSRMKTNRVRWWRKNGFNEVHLAKQFNSIFRYNINPEAKMTSVSI